MNLAEIKLSAQESNWRLFTIRKTDPSFLSYQDRVFQRDSYTCYYCGFQANTKQEVINLDGNYHRNCLENLVTTCIFCAQCFFLESIGKHDFGGGSLIYLPEMTQRDLNALCHVLFISLVSGNSFSSKSKNIYRSLRLRSQTVEQNLGEGMSNPALYGQLLIDARRHDKHEINAELSKQLRVLPSLNRFSGLVESWQINALNQLNFEE